MDHHFCFCVFGIILSWTLLFVSVIIVFLGCLMLLLMVSEGLKEHWSGLWRRKHWFNGFGFPSCSWWWSACHRVSLFSSPLFFFLVKFSLSLFSPKDFGGKEDHEIRANYACVGLFLHWHYLSCYCLLQSYSQDTHASRGMSASASRKSF